MRQLDEGKGLNKAACPIFLALLVMFLAPELAMTQPNGELPHVGQQMQAGPVQPGEFRRDSKGLGCRLSTFEVTYRSCLKIGPFTIGDDLTTVERQVGKPAKVIPQPNGVEARLYPIETSRSAEGLKLLSYWVIGYQNAKTTSIQLTGQPTKEGFTFSSIRLGDPVEKVLRLLGEPTSKSPVSGFNAISWNYAPFPFSLEMKDGSVFSIRVQERTAKN